MNEVEYHEIEFTDWECNLANLNAACTELEPAMKIQAVLDPCTKLKIGLFFQHKIKLSSPGGLILNCTAEHVFICPGISGYSFSQMKELVETAHQRFKDKLLDRSTIEKIPFQLDCVVNDFEVAQAMEQLKN